MANNVSISEGDGDKIVKSTDIGGFQIQHVILDSEAGVAVDLAAALALQLAELEDVNTNLTTPATQLPPQVPALSGNTAFTYLEISEAALNGSATIVSATSSQSTRVHGLFLTFSAAVAETLVEFRSGTTVLGSVKVPATPNQLVVDRRDIQYWIYKTANNETFNINTGAAVNVYGDVMYVKGV